MHISIVGREDQFNELKTKLGLHHSYHFSAKSGDDFYAGSEIAFDFTLGDHPSSLDFYNSLHLPVFADVSFSSLRRMVPHDPMPLQTGLFGFCGLPTLINRPMIEVSVLYHHDQAIVKRFFEKLNLPFVFVADQPGLITARVIAMIINEAYFTLEDGTSSKEDIDLAMKLGTNYPLGPFEWCERIGRKNIVKLLKAVYEESGDDRYKICRNLEI
jgi:3-hydroxybutyryl-CoA dehydrogenase